MTQGRLQEFAGHPPCKEVHGERCAPLFPSVGVTRASDDARSLLLQDLDGADDRVLSDAREADGQSAVAYRGRG